MFLSDNPIMRENEDLLDRKKFSAHLAIAICEWKDKESLVIALNGEWGVGKTSIINIALSQIKTINTDDFPTIVSFNPWIYSDLNSITSHFFGEISKELEIQNQTAKDKKIAHKLKLYASLLNVFPEKNIIKSSYDKFVIGLGLAGISVSSIADWLNINNKTLRLILFVGGAALLFKQVAQSFLSKLSVYYEGKSKFSNPTALDLKKEITAELAERNKKLVIIIDDIDRLTNGEIKEIFRLIKVNADFPNTIYLLSFDRHVVELSLDNSLGVSGSKYLEKIIQVTFDIPEARTVDVHKYLFMHLDRILSTLPSSVEKFFSSESAYWGNIFHSGVRQYLKNLRTVKRYISSLEFNISQMYTGETIEINPVDFIAIECIRIFEPGFYNFMRQNKDLFTSTRSEYNSRNDTQRQTSIVNALTSQAVTNSDTLTELIKQLFPQLQGVIENGNSSYGYSWISGWTKELRVCSPTHFDSYFAYLPKGSSEQISQFELESAMQKIRDRNEFESELQCYIANGKIRELLGLFQDYTDDETKFPTQYFENIIVPLLDITDSLPSERKGMADFGSDWDVMRVIYQLLKRENNKELNYTLLRDAVNQSSSLYAIFLKISTESPSNQNSKIKLLTEEHLADLKKLCIERLKIHTNDNELLENSHLLYILYRWKEWDQSDDLNLYIKRIVSDDVSLLKFLQKYRHHSHVTTMGDYVSRSLITFNFTNLSDLVPETDKIKHRIESIKSSTNLYDSYKEVIDSFVTNYGKEHDRDD
ncbi:KAP family P-loop NTPase fold protein [Cohnella yongneupensis]|uniref:P-loop NTPase fold protein n=1 Tax=Cohnella yongneupensis TaxID=425006 RepID=A0ABW0R3H5_9BACL